MNLHTYLNLEQTRLFKKRTILENKLSNMPSGHIRFDKNGNSWKWRRISDDDRAAHKIVYIPKKNTSLAETLSLKTHIEDSISKINLQLSLIQQFILDYPDLPDFPDRLTINNDDYKKLLAPYFEKKRKIISDWISEPFEHSNERPERLIVPTKSDIMVRSKSEAMIANELFDHSIPFRYEMAHIFGDLTIYPDFTILNPNTPNDIVIWEHFGLLDNSSYAQNAKIKLGTYLDANYIPGKNLIVTYESKDMPLDINYVSLMVAYHFL